MAGRSGSRRKQIVTYGLAGLVLVVMAFPLYGIALTSITPLLFTSDLSILTVTLGLFRSTMDIAIGQLAAATVVTALPVILITAFFQKNITEVITAGVER